MMEARCYHDDRNAQLGFQVVFGSTALPLDLYEEQDHTRVRQRVRKKPPSKKRRSPCPRRNANS